LILYCEPILDDGVHERRRFWVAERLSAAICGLSLAPAFGRCDCHQDAMTSVEAVKAA
jgi:hypothetical protein